MKKCYSLLRWPCLLQDVLNRHCSKQTGSSSTKETITHHFLRFWNWAEKTVDAAKICGAENVVKTETANIRKWITPVLLL